MAGRWLLVGAVVLALVPVLIPWTKVLLTIALAKGLAVLGIVVLLRAGQVSFGHAMYFATGAYACAFLARYLGASDLVLQLVTAVVVSTLLGAVIGVFVVRYRYIFFGMLNLAFSMVLFSVLEKFFDVTGGSDGIRIERPRVLGLELAREPFEYGLYWGTLAIAVLAGIGIARYLASPPGQALQAIKTNETRLEYLGISARRVLLGAYMLSAALGGLGGAIAGMAQGLATPEFAYWVRSGELVFIAILGGAGHVAGAFAGSIVYEGVRTYAAAQFADVWQMVLGVVMLLIILFSPGGIAGFGGGVLRRIRQRFS